MPLSILPSSASIVVRQRSAAFAVCRSSRFDANHGTAVKHRGATEGKQPVFAAFQSSRRILRTTAVVAASALLSVSLAPTASRAADPDTAYRVPSASITSPSDLVVSDNFVALESEPDSITTRLNQPWDERVQQGCFTCSPSSRKTFQFLPRNHLYPFYLADLKASRMSGRWIDVEGGNTFLDSNLGGRFGLLRYADNHPLFPRGWQIDFEGSAQLRLDNDNEMDVHSADFRAGIPISVSHGRWAYRFGYYHLSSHLGDEFLLRNPGFNRLNFSRDVLYLGGSYWLNERSRVYGESGYAFYCDVSEQWEFSMGYESAPRRPTGLCGEPFFAVHGHLREELDYGGSVNVELGWAWRSQHSPGLLRTGLQYYNGKSSQYSFFDEFEEQIGLGLWYDF